MFIEIQDSRGNAMAAYSTNKHCRVVVTEAEATMDERSQALVAEEEDLGDDDLRLYNEITF